MLLTDAKGDHMLQDGQEILNTILFDIRSALTTLRGVVQVVLDDSEAIPASTLAWFRKWKPTIDRWADKEQEARRQGTYSHNTTANWEEIIAQLGHNLSEVNTAESETQGLPLPEGREVQDLVRQAIKATKQLEELQQLIQSQEYKRLWANRS